MLIFPDQISSEEFRERFESNDNYSVTKAKSSDSDSISQSLDDESSDGKESVNIEEIS